MICIKKKSTGHEDLWRFNANKYSKMFAYLPVLNGIHRPIRNQVVAAFDSRCALLYELCSAHQD